MAKNSDKPPRISVNKLAEFMLAKAGRQRQILRDQKYPTDFKGMFHKEAAESIATCIASGLENVDVLDKRIAVLDQMECEKMGAQRRVNANIDALESFKLMLDDIDLKGADPVLGAQSVPKLTVHGVAVSVRPEIVLKGIGKSGALAGALKLHFPTTFPLSEETAGYVSALSQEWSKIHLCDDGTAHGPYCMVLDVGSRKVYAGVKATANRMKDIEAACENIAALWPSITPGPS